MVNEFLNKYKLTAASIDTNQTIKRFNAETDKGLSRFNNITECSIPTLPTYINRNIKRIDNKDYILIDAGGTNFRSCTGRFNDGMFEVNKLVKCEMPGSKKEVSKKEFFDAIKEKLEPLLNDAKDIGFCFSYQLKMQNDLDGRLVCWSKEMKAPEVVGLKIGEELVNNLGGNRDIAITNDTTAVLLGSFDQDTTCDKYIGCIFGTGFNLCYEEKASNIKKINDYDEELMIINTETGNFNGFDKGEIDYELTNESSIPNEGLTEKLVSGVYLPIIIRKALIRYSTEYLNKQLDIPTLSMVDVSNFLLGNNTLFDCLDISNNDIKDIILNILDRASKVAAITISSFAIREESKKVGICLEGTTVYKTPTLMDNLKKHLDNILGEHNINYSIIDGRDKILKGALYSIMKKSIQ